MIKELGEILLDWHRDIKPENILINADGDAYYPSYTRDEIKELMENIEWYFNKSKDELKNLSGDDKKRMEIILKMIDPKVDNRISSEEVFSLINKI